MLDFFFRIIFFGSVSSFARKEVVEKLLSIIYIVWFLQSNRWKILESIERGKWIFFSGRYTVERVLMLGNVHRIISRDLGVPCCNWYYNFFRTKNSIPIFTLLEDFNIHSCSDASFRGTHFLSTPPRSSLTFSFVFYLSLVWRQQGRYSNRNLSIMINGFH